MFRPFTNGLSQILVTDTCNLTWYQTVINAIPALTKLYKQWTEEDLIQYEEEQFNMFAHYDFPYLVEEEQTGASWQCVHFIR